MRCCTFFGHRECPDTVRPQLKKIIIQLIRIEKVKMFYVGNQGRFDSIVLGVLKELRQECDDFEFGIVLAYHPEPGRKECTDFEYTMFPEELERVHPRYAISKRNDWMLVHSDYVVCYVEHSWGGAARYAEKAQRMKKNIYRVYR